MTKLKTILYYTVNYLPNNFFCVRNSTNLITKISQFQVFITIINSRYIDYFLRFIFKN